MQELRRLRQNDPMRHNPDSEESMKRTNDFHRRHEAMLFALLATAIFAPVLLEHWPPGAPAWAGGAIALAALFGALLLFWRAGALRTRFLLGLAAMVCLAAVAGVLLGNG